MVAQKFFPVLPGSVYKVDRIDVSIQSTDFLIIYTSTLFACWLATYFPARKGSQLQIMDGLREQSE